MGYITDEQSDNNSRIFLDRQDILESIEEIVREYNDSKDKFYKLFVFYGMGGIGKSQLIQKIVNLYQGGRCAVYHIPLEILNQETIPSILLCIRQKFEYTPHFDYALFKYWDIISYDRIDRTNFYSIYSKIIKKLAKTFDSTIGRSFTDIEHLVSHLIELYEEREITDQEKENVSILFQDKIEKVYTYLSGKLAEDIEKELSGQKFMFLFDAYDLGRSKYKFDWLKIFVNSFQDGLFFVTSREQLNWFECKSVNYSMIKSYSLDCIPQEVVQEYLLQQHYEQCQIDCIIKNTECIPLYLDLALKMDKNKFLNNDNDIGLDTKENLVRDFLNHLSINEQTIIEYLSVVGYFNETIYDYAVKFNNFSPINFDFSKFKKTTIVRYIEDFNGLYQIHAVLAKNIAYFVSAPIRAKIIDNYLLIIHARILPDETLRDDTKFTLIVNVYRLIERENITVSELQSEHLIDLFFYLLDRGYGNDFYNYILSVDKKQGSHLYYIYKYIIGKFIRGSDIAKGLNCLQSIPLEECNFGKHKKSLVCDINYVLSISGKYTEAEKRMNEFVDTLTVYEKNENYYIKGIIYNSDMQMLRGKFKSVVMQLELLVNDVNDKKLYYEIQKAIGHCYRFNFLFDEALKYYSKTDNRTYNMSYYYTVCCETYCYYEPQKVFNLYEEAIEENRKYNNHNNLGKIYYSMAIACIVSHNTQQALRFIKKAHKEFGNTKYHAGNLFTTMAEIYLEYSKKHDISDETVIKINKQIKKIDDIYKYLLLPIYIIKGNMKMIQSIESGYEWFDFPKTLENINYFLEQL